MRSVSVHIGGRKYTLRSDKKEDDVQSVAQFVDARLARLQANTRTADSQALAVLAALQIAEELLAEQEAHRALKKAVKVKGERLLEMLGSLEVDKGPL